MEAEAAFRRGNDAIADAARRVALGDTSVDFICECADPQCFARVHLTLVEYDRLRNDGRSVAIQGHQPPAA